QQLAALRAILRLVLLAEPRAHLRAMARRGEVAERRHEPVPARIRQLAGDDLDLIPVRERSVERHDAPVDLRAAAAVAEIRMHLVRIIERRRAPRQLDDLRSEEHTSELQSR